MITKETDPFYRTRRWKVLRASILRRDEYQCQVSKRYGRLRQADTVHHILPRDKWPEYQWEAWNLTSLCAEQHNRMHDRDTGELTAEGLALAERTARARGISL